MKEVSFVGQSTVLGAPADWHSERYGNCGGLPVKFETIEGVPYVSSYWRPSADDLAALAAGAHVKLMIVGRNQPPVAMMVEKAEEVS